MKPYIPLHPKKLNHFHFEIHSSPLTPSPPYPQRLSPTVQTVFAKSEKILM